VLLLLAKTYKLKQCMINHCMLMHCSCCCCLQDMLTDACASCEPYDGGYAHWGMLQVRGGGVVLRVGF
jgi:hypothetical protein